MTGMVRARLGAAGEWLDSEAVTAWVKFAQTITGAAGAALAVMVVSDGPRWAQRAIAWPIVVAAGVMAMWVFATFPASLRKAREQQEFAAVFLASLRDQEDDR